MQNHAHRNGLVKQAIASALRRGAEDHSRLGEEINHKLSDPVLRLHRTTVEQITLLDPVCPRRWRQGTRR